MKINFSRLTRYLKHPFSFVRIFKKKNELARIMYKVAYYVELAGELANKPRKNGGNMFRHQMIVFSILIQYGYYDVVLLKASIIHDLFEDFPEKVYLFEKLILKNDPIDGPSVIFLVNEVSISKTEEKKDFYIRIFTKQSKKARVLKIVDNISNMTHLAHHGDEAFTVRYIKIVEGVTLFYSEKIDGRLHSELIKLIALKKERMKTWIKGQEK